MAFRGNHGGGFREGGGGGGGGRGKNRSSPYAKERPFRSGRGGNWRRREEERGGPRDRMPPLGPEFDEQRMGPPLLLDPGLPLLEQNDEERPPPMEEKPPAGPKKFSNKARLFFGNLPRDFTEAELRGLLEEHGEVQEVYHNREKSFAFARMAYRGEAEKVILNHNGQTIRGRDIKVRFAASSCSVKVHNLNPTVSNELLTDAFSAFGEVEEALVATDDRGKPLGYGIVDFARKGQAQSALQQCRNESFLLTKTPVPVTVSELVRDNEDGLPEKNIPKGNMYHFEREAPPRFPAPGSLEYDVAMRWKAYFDQERVEKEELEQKLRQMKANIQQEMDTIKEQHQTLMLRQEIARHQQEQMRLGERLRQQEERLQGLHSAQGSSGILPLFGHMPVPLYTQPPPSNPPGDGNEVPTSQGGELGLPPPGVSDYPMPLRPPPMSSQPPLFMNPPPLMGQKPR